MAMRSPRTVPIRWLRDERGQSPVGSILIFPLFITIIFAIVQGALFYHAQTAAHAAAAAGYQSARTLNASPGNGYTAAGEVLARHTDVLPQASVNISRSDTTVTVTVTGASSSLVTWWAAPGIEQRVSGPVERVLP